MAKRIGLLPELLSPAGTFEALEAAVNNGADAVYFGASGFNARMNAGNFDDKAINDAIALCHMYGVKAYLTLNTLVYDREMKDFLSIADKVCAAGADALIVADLGGASLIKKYIADAVLHASTQVSGHNTDISVRLQALGFTRMVCAREMSLADIIRFVEESPIEAEVFLHGALCVSHSGQCLFSSLVGGRSGNRGECAQPCRLPGSICGKKGYPLSLKDLCLAEHIPELIDSGVASLKIEGRMKSPEYVGAVTSVYRRLLDERRAANSDEMEYLASVFSRDGFTDKYFIGSPDASMSGIRRDTDKKRSREIQLPLREKRRIPIELSASFCTGSPMMLSATAAGKTVAVSGDIPERAINCPTGEDAVRKSLSKLGETPFVLAGIKIEMDRDLMLPVSSLNRLRRDAVCKLEAAIKESILRPTCRMIDRDIELIDVSSESKNKLDQRMIPADKCILSAEFRSCDQIPADADEFFDIIYLPLENYNKRANGVTLPPVIFDSERADIEKMLDAARAEGAVYAEVGNLGHLDMVEKKGFAVLGGIRVNASNSMSTLYMLSQRLERVLLSPELTMPRINGICNNICNSCGTSLSAAGMVIYGRVPLMVTERCPVKSIAGKKGCEMCRRGETFLKDRMGISFPITRTWKHRSVIWNSRPVWMLDRSECREMALLGQKHFIFVTESAEEVSNVIDAYRERRAPTGECRRIPM